MPRRVVVVENIYTMLILHFGTDFDGPVYTEKKVVRAGELFVGPTRLLQWLEGQLGLPGLSAK